MITPEQRLDIMKELRGKGEWISVIEIAKILTAHTEPEDERYTVAREVLDEYLNETNRPRGVVGVLLGGWLDAKANTEPEDDHLASPDATWEELGRGFIEVEPDMSEGGK